MNNRVHSTVRVAQLALLLLLLSTLNSQLSTVFAQGTAFTYQGQLTDAGSPASGLYDLRFTVYNASSGGATVGATLDAADQGVTNGLFTVTLDFGAGVFTGANRWLEISVRPGASGGAFTALTPRQKLNASPYAVFAGGASAAGITGTLPSAALIGNYNSTVSFNNGANSFNGSFYGQFFGTSFTGGTFSGDGSGLLNLNASQISEGAFPASSLENAWRIIGNSGTTGTNFIGTTDNQPLDFRVNNVRGFRIEPDQRPGNDAANIIGGHFSNRVEQAGTSGGSVIVGGGFAGGANVIHSNSSGVFIGAGSANEIGPNANDVVIAGGFANSARTYGAVIGGGGYSLIATNADYSTIGGGLNHFILTASGYSFIGGGYNHSIQNDSGFSIIGGGYQNVIQTNSGFAAIGGGFQNQILPFSGNSVIAGGNLNQIQSSAGNSAIGGGLLNIIGTAADQSVIGGGNANQILSVSRESFIGGGFANLIMSNSFNATIGGGAYNMISNASQTTIGGGIGNTNTGYAGTVAGGFFNTAANNGAAVGGGGQNVALGFNSAVAGGNNNFASGSDSAIPGGFHNLASGSSSFAAGRQARALHQGAFVWADSTAADFNSIAANEFAVRAGGGVRFITTGPGLTLNGLPILTATSTNVLTLTNVANTFNGTFTGNGAGLTNLNAWELDGNSGTTAGVNFLGTTDSQPLELRVNNQRRILLDLNANIVVGSSSSAGDPPVISSGILSGSSHQIRSNSFRSVIAGGQGNTMSNATTSAIGGGQNNTISNSAFSTIGGGVANVAYGAAATISGGNGNQALADRATVAGGAGNAATGDSSFIGGGGNNFTPNGHTVIVGGSGNFNFSAFGFLGAGRSNTIPGADEAVTLAGGRNNSASGVYASLGGGFQNTNTGGYSTIPGGTLNRAVGDYSFAAGRQAKANHQGTFVWADSQGTDFNSGNANQFLVRAVNGVGINTNNPTAALHIGGTPGTDGIRYPDNTLQTTAPIPVFASGPGSNPQTTNTFLALPVTVTVTSFNQKILVTSHKAFGSVSAAGAINLNLSIGFRASGGGGSPTAVGNGIFGNRVPQNTQVILGMSGVISGLAPGNYDVGLMGLSSDAANWNNNEFSQTTATVY